MLMSTPLTAFPCTAVHENDLDLHQNLLLAQSENILQTPSERQKVPPLDIASVQRSTVSVVIEPESPCGPISPLVFRRNSSFWEDSSHIHDPHAGSSGQGNYGHGPFQPSCDNDIFVSSSEPSSGASSHLLSSCFYPTQSSLRSPFPARPIPPRSSSLRSLFQIQSAPMSRAASPCPSVVGDDRCSERMIFAPKDPNEPKYGSAPSSVSLSPSSSVLSVPSPRYFPMSSRNDALSARSLSPSPSARSRSPIPTNIRVPNGDSLSVFPGPHGVGAFPFFGAPTPEVTPRRPKAKSVDSAVPSSLALAGTTLTQSNQQSKLTPLKRVRQIVKRKSISSLEAMMRSIASTEQPQPQPQTQSQVTSSSTPFSESPSSTASPSRLSSDSRWQNEDFTDRPPITITPSDSSIDVEHKFYAHRVVDGVWQKQEISDVIPALRSLKFGRKH